MDSKKILNSAARHTATEVTPGTGSIVHLVAWGAVAAMCVIGAVVVVLVPNPNPAILIKAVAVGAITVCLLLALEKRMG
jgi:hypothetical protein